jgi:hypothetical protein
MEILGDMFRHRIPTTCTAIQSLPTHRKKCARNGQGEVMRNIRNIFTMAILAAVVFMAMCATAQSTNPAFTLNLGTKKIEVRASDDVWIKIVQTNVSNHRIDCKYTGGNAVNRQYRYEVTDEDGNPAEKVVPSAHVPPPGDYMQCELDPGESNTNTICLSNVFKLDRPGKYTVQVWRDDPDTKDSEGNPTKVYSNTITITITG